MNSTPSKPSIIPGRLAKMSWQLWLAAIIIIAVNRGLPIKVPAETFALLLISVGFLLGIVMVLTIPKYGTKDILKSALAGMALNGILLSIAIPNFIHARNHALEKFEGNWQEYKVAGLQFLSPIILTNLSAATEENPNKETYMGQLYSFTVLIHRRTMSADDNYTLDSFTAGVVELMRKQSTANLQFNTREVVIDGIPSKRLSVQYPRQGFLVKDTALIIFKQPYIWEIQILGPEKFPGIDAKTEKILNSIKLLPPES